MNDLFRLLQKWRNEEALNRNVPRYRVMPDCALRTLASLDPTIAAWGFLMRRKIPRT